MWYFVTAALGNPCRQLAHPWCPSNAIQTSWHYPLSTNEAVETLQVSVTCLKFWLVAEQDTNPGLLIPSCWEQPSSAWPTAFFLFFFFFCRGKGRSSESWSLLPCVSHYRSSAESISLLSYLSLFTWALKWVRGKISH